jgi:hypothetical protein
MRALLKNCDKCRRFFEVPLSVAAHAFQEIEKQH